ncbi:hypothetical protein [Streptomyces sp. SP18CS02]|uniref:hypothetical protein n=1 Tax=Streptomyces sp. SP18CS02 TaxID=3002531 RepID=UPI002E788F68|nr:hypothetical protein [Streptomyces sp. SP18CS02]MEE1753296.1 hypothetical protein [Streptomyces sp. SP18CS02]
MPTIDAQTAALVSALAAATGTQPTVDEAPQRVRVEAEIPADLADAEWSALLLALRSADRFGHDRTAERATVWAELDRRQQ